MNNSRFSQGSGGKEKCFSILEFQGAILKDPTNLTGTWLYHCGIWVHSKNDTLVYVVKEYSKLHLVKQFIFSMLLFGTRNQYLTCSILTEQIVA